MSAPQIVIIIGPHAHHFSSLAEAQAFLAEQSEHAS